MNRSLRCALALLSLAIASHVRAEGAAEPPGAAEPAAVESPPPQRVSGAVTDDAPLRDRLIVPPYVHDVHGDVRTTALFPFYFARTTPTDVQRFVLPYYYRRGPKLQADVAAGLVWSLRGPDRNTFVLPPFYTHRNGKDWGVALLPLFSAGSFSGRRHTVIPPLLTWYDAKDDHHRLVAGPYYDVRRKEARWRGLFPIFWSKQGTSDGFAVVPPLFFRFTEQAPDSATTVVPPFYYTRSEKERSWGLVPLAFHSRSAELRSTTVPLALFHHARGPKQFRLVTPLLGYRRDEQHGKTWITPIYQRRRGDSNFDAVAPLFFRTWDNRDGSRGLYLPPIYWQWSDPANQRLVIFPFLARDHRDGISDLLVLPVLGRKKSLERDAQTWWVLPTFHAAWDDTSWQFNLHPIFYLKRSPEKRHLAVAPLWFDFENLKKKTRRRALFPLYWDFENKAEQKQTRVVFPFYWQLDNAKTQRRHRVGFPIYWDLGYGDRNERYTVAFPFYGRGVVGERTRHFVLNTMVERHASKDKRWAFHFFPLVSMGGSERDQWWRFLLGLAGYDRRGPHRRIHALWLPFNLKDRPEPGAATGATLTPAPAPAAPAPTAPSPAAEPAATAPAAN